MYLTEEEKRVLDGEKEEGYKLVMEIFVAVGEAFDAERMVPIQSGHTILSTYKGILTRRRYR